MKEFFIEDLSPYKYFLKEYQIKGFMKKKIVFAILPVIILPLFNLMDYLILLPFLMVIFYKIPYFMLKTQHNQNCNDVVSAIPLWLNTISALVEKNNIHNAIINSSNDNTPVPIKKDLEEFVKRIEQEPNDKKAYTTFLKKYNRSGFEEIMLKLFEFRSLSKDKVKKEMLELNENIEEFQHEKRINRLANEKLSIDIYMSLMLGIPCLISALLSFQISWF